MKPAALNPTKEPLALPWWQTKLAKNAGLAFLILLAGGLVVWFFAFRPYVSTDDARVAEDLIRVAPDGVGGKVLTINVTEGDRVTQDQVLAELEHTVYQAQLQKAQAHAVMAQSDLNRASGLYRQNAHTSR